MSLRIVQTAVAIESSDEFHQARLLLLLCAAIGLRTDSKPLDGIMKLAKMDFLLRYPEMLVRALRAVENQKQRARAAAEAIPREDRDTIEARMIRFRYGPWDTRYRRWLSLLASKDLVVVYQEGRTVKIQMTPKGKQLARQFAGMEEFATLANRAQSVVLAVGDMSAGKVKDFIYRIAPELKEMKWGQCIDL